MPGVVCLVAVASGWWQVAVTERRFRDDAFDAGKTQKRFCEALKIEKTDDTQYPRRRDRSHGGGQTDVVTVSNQ